MLMSPKGRNGNSHKWVAIPTANTIMARAKDYTNKIQFWTEQLDTALLVGSSAYYSEERCRESLAYFKQKQRALEAYLEANLVAFAELTEEQHDRIASAHLIVSNLITELSESDPRWNAIWEEFCLFDAIEDHIKKLQL